MIFEGKKIEFFRAGKKGKKCHLDSIDECGNQFSSFFNAKYFLNISFSKFQISKWHSMS